MTCVDDTLRLESTMGPATQQETCVERIKRSVTEVERLLAPDVVRIRYEITTNWNDEPAIYFRAILSDEAVSTKARLVQNYGRVKDELDNRLDFEGMGLARYHHVRSVSEQAVLKEEAWA